MKSKILWPGIIIGVVSLIIGFILTYIFMLIPTYAADMNNASLIRSMQDPLMMVFFLYPFIIGFVYAWAWNKSKSLFKGDSCQRGIKFALSIFLIATIPGMFISYTSMPIALITILIWTLSGLINALIAGCILAKVNK